VSVITESKFIARRSATVRYNTKKTDAWSVFCFVRAHPRRVVFVLKIFISHAAWAHELPLA
jgi:hypothetical protein